MKDRVSMSGQLEEFKPLHDNQVGMYTCGPTVYDFAHIGNYRTFVFQDILRRWLKYRGYELRHVMNLTDVDDNTIRKSKAAGLSLRDYTAKYIEAFQVDRQLLSLEDPEIVVRATDSIDDMVKMIQTLMEKGYAYASEGSIYFRVAAFPHYGQLTKIDLTGIRDGARIDSDKYDKNNARDFALWKAPKEGEPFWETPIGPGRPGCTDRKRAEQALQRSQFYLSEGERLAHIGSWASSDLGIRWSTIWIFIGPTKYTEFSALTRRTAPRTLSSIWPPSTLRTEPPWRKPVKVMHEQRLAMRCNEADCSTRRRDAVRSLRGCPVVEDRSLLKGIIGTTIDVTEQELLTRELRREQAYLAEAQSLTHIGSWATNFDTGQILHLSDEVFRLHGFDPNQGPIPLERFYDTLHPEDEPAVRAALENAIRARTDYDIPRVSDLSSRRQRYDSCAPLDITIALEN